MSQLCADLQVPRLLSSAISYLEFLFPFSLSSLALQRTFDAGRTRLSPELVAPVFDVLV